VAEDAIVVWTEVGAAIGWAAEVGAAIGWAAEVFAVGWAEVAAIGWAARCAVDVWKSAG
jgi:hypothetical protein